MLLRKTLLYSPAGIMSPLVQLATILVWTHWLTPTDLGVYALVVALQELVHLACMSWWSNYVLRYLDHGAGASRLAQDRTERAVMILSGVAQAFILPALAWVVIDGKSGWLFFTSIVMASVARSYVAHWSVRARAEQRILVYSLAQILAPVFTLGLGLLFLAAIEPDVTLVFAGMAGANILVAVLIGPHLGLTPSGLRLERETLRFALRFGALTMFGSGLAWASAQSVTFATDATLGTAAVGLLTVGWSLGQRIAAQVGFLASTAVLPLAIASARTEGLDRGLDRMSEGAILLLTAAFPAAVGTALVAPTAAQLLTAAPYHDATALLLPYAVAAGMLRIFRYNVLDETLQLVERPGLMVALDLVEACLSAILCLLGVIWAGILGAVVGSLIASALATIASLALVTFKFGFRIPIRPVIVALIATSAMAAVVKTIPMEISMISLIVSVFIGIIVFAIAYAACEYDRVASTIRNSVHRLKF